MSTWFKEDKRSWLQKFFGNILKAGPLPKHIAIIMDGNRRYAKNHNLQKIEGHKSGFDKLVEALTWCFTMDIKEVTVYAFSIENFKRSQEEVDGLFELATEKFKRLLNEKEKIDQMQVCIRVFGDISLLPEGLQQIISQVVDMSKNYTNLYMNVCLAYTSRDEMTMAVKDICTGIQEKKLQVSDISEELFEQCLYTANSYDVDLLLRTSGEVRLSDFMLWQSSYSVLSFVKETWPELSIWNFYMAILNFQMNYDAIQEMKASAKIFKETKPDNSYKKRVERTDSFLADLHNKRCRVYENIKATINTTSTTTESKKML